MKQTGPKVFPKTIPQDSLLRDQVTKCYIVFTMYADTLMHVSLASGGVKVMVKLFFHVTFSTFTLFG